MARDDQLCYIAWGRRMEQSTGQQLKVIPFGDQQPFPLQLGKLHRHGSTLHAEKIRQLLTVKGNVKGCNCKKKKKTPTTGEYRYDSEDHPY